MPELSLKEVFQHPFVRELVEQNEQMAEALPDENFSFQVDPDSVDSTQTLSSKKIDLDKIKTPHLIKDRLLFQEGLHKGLFYPFEEIKENLDEWDNASLFMAEHVDASDKWIGISKNPRVVEKEKAIYGDLDLVDKAAAQKIEYQILNKNGKMGISPTIDVDKQMINGQMCALGPYHIQSQSVVLEPAVRATVFNSAQGGAKMEKETQDLKNDEIVIKKEELDRLKSVEKELQEFQKKELSKEVEELTQLGLAIGRLDEEESSTKKQEFEKMSQEERQVLFKEWKWLSEELTEKPDEVSFMDSLPEELKGKIPPGLRKYIEEKRKKKKEEEMAKTKGEIEQEEEEENPKKKKAKKKYPYPEKQSLDEGGERQELSRQKHNLVLAREADINRFQKLSEESKEANQEFIDFLLRNQGGG